MIAIIVQHLSAKSKRNLPNYAKKLFIYRACVAHLLEIRKSDKGGDMC
jgi:hypothetical protein